jgi:hypothetical protein
MSEDIIAELTRLAKANDGRLTPDNVVDAAEDEASPLHQCFEWDNDAAAHMFRVEQARHLIRSVRVDVTTSHHTVRVPAFVHDPECERGEQGYVSIRQLSSDEDKSREVVIAEFSRAASALRRARAVAMALGIEEQIDDISEQIKRVVDSVQAVAA